MLQISILSCQRAVHRTLVQIMRVKMEQMLRQMKMMEHILIQMIFCLQISCEVLHIVVGILWEMEYMIEILSCLIVCVDLRRRQGLLNIHMSREGIICQNQRRKRSPLACGQLSRIILERTSLEFVFLFILMNHCLLCKSALKIWSIHTWLIEHWNGESRSGLQLCFLLSQSRFKAWCPSYIYIPGSWDACLSLFI